MLDATIYPKIHNRFDIYKNGEQVGYAENIILDQMWTRLCGGSTYFVNIHYGTGTGTLSATRTSLFTHLGTAAAGNVAQVRAIPTSHWRRSITLALETANGNTLTEVGIAFGSTASNLVTHALIRDMNGNVIGIPKTNLDIITIFATVYFTLDNSNANIKLLHPNTNGLIDYLMGGSFPTAIFKAGECGLDAEWPRGLLANALVDSASGSWVNDTANKRRSTQLLRFGITQGNGDVTEILAAGTARLKLPASGIYTGLELVSVPLGTGDGNTTEFTLPSKNVKKSSLVIKVNGVEEAGVTFIDLPTSNGIASIMSSSGINSTGGDIAFSGNGLVIVLTTDMNSPNSIRVADFETISKSWVLRSTPNIPGRGFSCALSHDGGVLAVGTNSSPFVRVFDWVNNSWVTRSNPPNLPASTVDSVAISGDGLVLAFETKSTSPFIRIFDWIDNAWVARSTPPGMATLNSGIALNYSGSLLAASISTNPFLKTYDWVDDAWVARSNPVDLPAGGNYQTVRLTSNGLTLSVSASTSPYAWVYDWIDDAWVKRTNIPNMPAPVGKCALSETGLSFMSIFSASPKNNVWDWVNNLWVSRDVVTPAVEVNASPTGCAINEMDSAVSCNGNYVQKMFMYRWSQNKLKVNFTTAPAAGAVITADYTVDGIHKTSQRIIDCTFTIQFGEPT